ncbi:hypothetical protein NMK71_05710 [Weeksellaceae bacterium KMM 9713]|uniref:Uncharacterized protein n=1 Tax=Profundicola chukchiensis TaxID=2961959 RepID=A0A9X4MXG2_9FLAO|nr:hypothetical protein [Profundicola chukchiensis]MDG4945903.1 hypothetical protein [Profundicola chukchiensis]
MKNLFLTAVISFSFLNVACERKAENIQENDTTSEKVLEGEQIPEQYHGSTGVDDENNNMVANENIELKKQEFRGSFSSPKTQSFTFNVLNEAKEYSFRLESSNSGVKYLVKQKDGKVVQEATSETTRMTLNPGEYEVVGLLDSEGSNQEASKTDFVIYIE